ncbi:MAG TPA: patatin-like phospholipase family protein, partial [Longimicrobiales bacterium]
PWDALFAPTRVLLGPERDLRQPMLSLDLDATTLRVSRGLLGQWRINRELGRALFDANARARGDFDRLPRRYRAVAADLRTGDLVVQANGDLARSVRASMAVPGFFAPVERDGVVLVDGAIAANLPVGVARRMGAQRIMASDVAAPPEEIHSLAPLAVLSRSLDLMQQNAQRDTVVPDALVLPDLDPSMSSAAFPRDPSPLIELGIAAALRDAPRVPHDAVAVRAELPPPAAFDSLVIESPSTALAGLARGAFAHVAPGAYSEERVLRAMDVLYTTGLFEGVWPRVSTTDSATALVVRLEGQPALSLSAAAGYESDRGGRVWVSADRFTSIGGRPAFMTAAGSSTGVERWASGSIRVYSFSNPGVAWSLGLHGQERDIRSFEDDAMRVREVTRLGGWLGIELPRSLQQRTMTAAMRGEWVQQEGGEDGYAVGPLLRWADVDADTRVVGVPLLIEGEARGGSVDYARFAVSASRTVSAGSFEAAALIDVRAASPGAPFDVQPALGDGHAIPGLRWGTGHGRSRIVTGVDGAFLIPSGFVRMRLRTGAAQRALNFADGARWVTGADLGVGWQSPVGTVEVSYGRATRDDGRFDVSVGRKF